jgi:hypothetical protein
MKKLIESANGMLPMSVYDEIFAIASRAGAVNYVEIGTAHGAATIAMALGALSKRSDFFINTVDRLGGVFSSRSRYGSEDDNKKIVIQNLTRAGVEKYVELFVGSSDEFVSSGRCPSKIDFLMLDADGRIDRDLMHFYTRMSPGTPVIIDDIDENIYFNSNHKGMHYIDLKHLITSKLLKAYCDAGFLQVEKTIDATAFCRRGGSEFNKELFLQTSLSCYRELVFAGVDDFFWQELMDWRERSNEVREGLRLRSCIPQRFHKIVLMGGKALNKIKRFLNKKTN